MKTCSDDFAELIRKCERKISTQKVRKSTYYQDEVVQKITSKVVQNATIKIAETMEEAERLGLRVGDSYIEYEPAKVVKQDF